ncbi:MAG: urease accessory protein UreE [Terracidiphilus sp.]
MLLIDHLIGHAHASDLPGRQCDSLVLNSEQRRWVRGRFVTAQGREVALALPTGTILEPGQILCVEEDWYLRVQAAPEPVLAISPADSRSAVRIAFEVGNRHFPLAMDGEKMLVPDDPAMAQLLERLGVAWERTNAVFQPIGHAHRHEH